MVASESEKFFLVRINVKMSFRFLTLYVNRFYYSNQVAKGVVLIMYALIQALDWLPSRRKISAFSLRPHAVSISGYSDSRCCRWIHLNWQNGQLFSVGREYPRVHLLDEA